MLLVLLMSCNRLQRVTPAELKPLVGRWRPVATQQTTNGDTTWNASTASAAADLFVRYDGVLLEGKGLQLCCAPPALRLNGTLIPIEPRDEVPVNPACASIRCLNCPAWSIALSGDEFVVTYCDGGRTRYARVR
ncbi:hypothetical protein GCM10027275_56220 [Rhabdobacter roseus]